MGTRLLRLRNGLRLRSSRRAYGDEVVTAVATNRCASTDRERQEGPVQHQASSEDRGAGAFRWINRVLVLLRAGWGAALMARPRQVGELVGADVSHTTWGRRILRVLAARHLGQAAVTAARPSAAVLTLGAVVDLLHALSAVVFGLVKPKYRRAGMRDASLAAGFGVAGAVVGRGMANRSDEEWASGPVPPAARRDLPETLSDGLTVPVLSEQAGPVLTSDGTAHRRIEKHPTSPSPEHQTDQHQTDRHQTDRHQTDRHQTDRHQTDEQKGPGMTAKTTSSADRDSLRPTRAVVHPRVMWGGVLLVLIGMFAIAWAMMQRSETWIIVGVVVLAIGALVAWRGGILHDVQATQAMSNEVHAAVHGDEHEGVVAGQELHDPDAQAAAARTARETRTVLDSRVAAPGPPIGPAASLGLLLLGVWLFVGAFTLPYYYTVTGVNSTNRALGAAIVVVLCALWMRHVSTSLVAAGLASLVGAALVVGAFLLTHNDIWVRYQEGVTGSLIVLCAVLAVVSARRARRRDPRRT